MKINADAADIILRGVTSGTERLVNAFGITSEITANNKTGLCVYAALRSKEASNLFLDMHISGMR